MHAVYLLNDLHSKERYFSYLVSDASEAQHDVVVVDATLLALRAQVEVFAHRAFVANAHDRIIGALRRAAVALHPVSAVPVAHFCRSRW